MKSVVVVALIGVAVTFVACSSQEARYTDVPVEVADSEGKPIALFNSSGETFPVKMSASNEELAAEELASSSQGPVPETAAAPEAPKKTALQELLHQELKAVFFETDEHELDDQAKAELDAVIAVLVEVPEAKIQVDGHADAPGTPTHNLRLSAKRAAEVRKYLDAKGVDASRVAVKARGETDSAERKATVTVVE